MKLSRRRACPIERPFRPDGPLVYARLSDPLLVKRSQDGDAKALAALCERHTWNAQKAARRGRNHLRDKLSTA